MGKGDDGHPAIEYTALSLIHERRLKWMGIENAVVRTHTFWNRGSGKGDRKKSFAGTCFRLAPSLLASASEGEKGEDGFHISESIQRIEEGRKEGGIWDYDCAVSFLELGYRPQRSREYPIPSITFRHTCM